jgi:two-component system, LuxR family, sensor kinase FixL
MKMQNQTTPIRQNRLANLLIEASPVSVVLTNTEETIEVVNRVTEDWFGYRESELIGKKWETLFPADSMSGGVSQSACYLSQLRDPDPGQSWEIMGRRKNGSTFSVRVTLHPLVTVSGDMILANVMTAHESDSIHEKRIAGERLAAVLEMASGLAHESRNALQRARSCLDLLELDLANNPELLQLTDRIRTALTDLRDNYEEVKDYATPIVLKRAVASLSQLCQASFDELACKHSDRSSSLRIRIHPWDDCVWIDASRMKQVFLQVFENAMVASPRRGEIFVNCRRVLTAGHSSLEMTIRDYGSGLTEEVAQRMFEPFFTTKQQGTGLGLAVCRRIIEAHGGTIEAANHPDGGAVLRIVLPT